MLSLKSLLIWYFNFSTFIFCSTETYSQKVNLVLKEQIERLIGFRKTVVVVVGVLNPEGNQIYVFRNPNAKQNGTADGNSLFEIGSVTKLFTASLLADMIQRGEVNLQQPVRQLLPDSIQVPSYKGQNIRLIDLVTHTSGLPRRPTNLSGSEENPYKDYSAASLYQFLSEYKLDRAIGSQYEYSNAGFGLLGYTLGLKAGQDFETMLKMRLLNPMDLTNTCITINQEEKSRMVRGHDLLGNKVGNWDLGSTLAGAGGLRSSVNDLLKFLTENMGPGKSGLQPTLMLTHIPQASEHNGKDSIGLGWHIRRNSGTDILWHNGLTGGYTSFVGLDKISQAGVVILTNFSVGEDLDRIGFELLDSLKKEPKKSTPAMIYSHCRKP